MRMKRFTAWAVSLVMLFSALPVQALADTTYAQDFYLVPGSDAAEDMFRRWAYELVTWYRGEYLLLDADNQYKQVAYQYEASDDTATGDTLLTLTGYRDQASHHLYYTAGRAFGLYQGEDSSRFHQSDWKAEMTSDQAMEAYMIILADTLWEKADMDPDFLTRDVPGGKTVRFSVSTGDLESDQLRENIQTSANVDALASGGHLVLSIGKTTADGLLIKHELMQSIKADAEQAAQDALKGKKTFSWRQCMNEIFLKLKTEAAAQLKNLGDDVINQCATQANLECSNAIKRIVAARLANAYMQASDVVVDTLQSVYVDNVDALQLAVYQPYADAARAMIETMQGSKTSTAALTEAISHTSGLVIEDTLSRDEMLRYILSAFVTRSMEYVVNCIAGILQSTAKAALSALGLNTVGSGVKQAEIINTLIAAECSDISVRLNKAIENALKEVSFQKEDTSLLGPWGQFWQALTGSSAEDDALDAALSGTWAKAMDGWEDTLSSNCTQFLFSMFALLEEDLFQHIGRDRTLVDATDTTADESAKAAHRKGDNYAMNFAEVFDQFTNGTFNPANMLVVMAVSLVSGGCEYLLGCIEQQLDKNNTASAAFLADMKKLKEQLASCTETLLSNKASGSTKQVNWEVLESAFVNAAYSYAMMDEDEQKHFQDALKDAVIHCFTDGSLLQSYIDQAKSAMKASGKTLFEGLCSELLSGEYGLDELNALELTLQTTLEHSEITEADNAVIQAATGKIEDLCANHLNEYATVKTISKLFNDCWEIGEDLGTLAEDTMTSMTGAATADYTGQLLESCWKISSAHEQTLRITTSMDMAGAGDRMKSDETSVWLYMAPENILDPEVCPDISAIKVVTDMILLQLNEDLVGMSNYVLLTINAPSVWKSTGYVGYISQHCGYILLPQRESKRLYQQMVDDYHYWTEDTYPFGQWNTLIFVGEVH